MGRPSSIDQEPEEVREAIADLRRNGHTIDQIVAHLRTMGSDVSRSALGRHIQGLDEALADLRRSREIAEVLVEQHGEGKVSRQAQANIELLHSAILKLNTKAATGEIVIGPKEAMALSISVEKLAAANKRDAEYLAQVRKEIAAEAAKALDRANDKLGKKIDAETLRTIRQEIYGIQT